MEDIQIAGRSYSGKNKRAYGLVLGVWGLAGGVGSSTRGRGGGSKGSFPPLESLKFPSTAVRNAVRRRNTRKRARKGAKERKRALPRKNCKQPQAKNNQVFQRFRKGVGGQRGVGATNPSHTIDSGPFSALFSLCPLMSKRTQFWGNCFPVFWVLLVANPLPPTPF